MIRLVHWRTHQYCCVSAGWHMQRALRASVSVVQNENLRRWALLSDGVLFQQAAITVGADGLKELAAEYIAQGLNFEAGEWIATADGFRRIPILYHHPYHQRRPSLAYNI